MPPSNQRGGKVQRVALGPTASAVGMQNDQCNFHRFTLTSDNRLARN